MEDGGWRMEEGGGTYDFGPSVRLSVRPPVRPSVCPISFRVRSVRPQNDQGAKPS